MRPGKLHPVNTAAWNRGCLIAGIALVAVVALGFRPFLRWFFNYFNDGP